MSEEYQNILNLAEIIEQKEEEVKEYEDNVKSATATAHEKISPISKFFKTYYQSLDYDADSGTPTNIPTTVDPHSDLEKLEHRKTLAELNEAIEIHANATSEYYREYAQKPELEEDQPEVEEDPQTLSQITPEFTEDDVLAPFRAQFGEGTSDAEIKGYLEAWKPELFQQMQPPPPEGRPESAQFQLPEIGFSPLSPIPGLKPGGGAVSQLQKTMKDYVIRNWTMDVPGWWTRFTERPFSSPERNEKKLRELLKKNGEMNDTQIEQYIDEIKRRGPDGTKLTDHITLEYNKMGRAYSKKVLDEDPDLAAYMNYHGSQGENIWRDNTGKLYIDKYLLKQIGDALPSIIESRGIGAGSAGIASLIPGVRGYQALVGIGSTFMYGLTVGGAGSQAQTLEYMLTEQPMSNEQFAKAVSDIRYTLQNEVRDENGNSPTYTQVQDAIKDYIANNYENRNGQMVRKAHTLEEALDGTWWTDMINGIGSGGIETLDRVFTLAKLPISGKLLNNGTAAKIAKRTSETIRQAPIIKHWKDLRKVEFGASRSKVWLNNTIDVLTGTGQKQWIEAVEEIATENFMLANRSYGPFRPFGAEEGMMARELKYDKGASWTDLWSLKEHVVGPGVGGLGGGKAFNSIKNVANIYLDATGLKSKLDNLSLDWQFKKNIMDGYSVNKAGRADYRIQRNTSFIDDKTGEIDYETSENVPEDIKETRFGTYRDAKEQVDLLNYVERTEGLRRIGAANQDIYKAEAKIEEEDGKFTVVIYNSNGKIHKKIKTYGDMGSAKRKMASINKNISKVNKVIDKYTDEQIDNLNKLNDYLKNQGDNFSRISRNTEARNNMEWIEDESTEGKKVPIKSESRVALLGFMIAKKKTDGKNIELTEEQEKILDRINEAGILTDYEVIGDIINYFPELLNEELIDKEALKELYNSQFPEHEDYLDDNAIYNDSNYTDETTTVEEIVIDVDTFTPDAEQTTFDFEQTTEEEITSETEFKLGIPDTDEVAEIKTVKITEQTDTYLLESLDLDGLDRDLVSQTIDQIIKDNPELKGKELQNKVRQTLMQLESSLTTSNKDSFTNRDFESIDRIVQYRTGEAKEPEGTRAEGKIDIDITGLSAEEIFNLLDKLMRDKLQRTIDWWIEKEKKELEEAGYIEEAKEIDEKDFYEHRGIFSKYFKNYRENGFYRGFNLLKETTRMMQREVMSFVEVLNSAVGYSGMGHKTKLDELLYELEFLHKMKEYLKDDLFKLDNPEEYKQVEKAVSDFEIELMSVLEKIAKKSKKKPPEDKGPTDKKKASEERPWKDIKDADLEVHLEAREKQLEEAMYPLGRDAGLRAKKSQPDPMKDGHNLIDVYKREIKEIKEEIKLRKKELADKYKIKLKPESKQKGKKKAPEKKVPKEVLDINKTMGLEQYNALKKWYDAGEPSYKTIHAKGSGYTPLEVKAIREHQDMLSREEGGVHGDSRVERDLESYFRKQKKAPEVKVETIKRYNVKTLRDNPDKVYLFGDNLIGKGRAGQAIIRNEPNAIGIPTKKKPAMTEDSFMTDNEYDTNVKAIDEAFAKIPKDKVVVLPEDGLGTGLAKLQEKAPRTHGHLQSKLAELKGKKKAPKVKSRVVSKGSVNAVRAAEKAGEGISVLRDFRKPKENYGNPFSALLDATATVKVETVQESIERYDAWLRGKADQDVEPEKRKWILEQIDKGVLDNVDLLYYKDTPDNHAKRLEAFVNERRKKTPEDKEIPNIIEGVSKLHRHSARGNLQTASESKVKNLFKQVRDVSSLVQDPKDKSKFSSIIDKAETDYFSGRYGDAQAKLEQAISLLHERAEFQHPDFKVTETGEIIIKKPGVEDEILKAPEVSKTPEFDKLPEKSETPTMTYAGIGSRKTPPEILEKMTEIAYTLENQGYTLRSGGAKGADTAFEKGTSPEVSEIYTTADATDETRKIAKEIHPLKDKLTIEKGLNFHARNTNQIFGENLDTPVDFVLVWTPEGKVIGGSGQAIKMAELKGIPVINMFEENWRDQLEDVLKDIEDDVVIDTTELAIYEARTDDIVLTNHQKKALSHVFEIVNPKAMQAIRDLYEKYKEKGVPDKILYSEKLGGRKVLAGYAGTGKTTIIENIILYADRLGFNVQVWAPTNQAVKNILDRLPKVVKDRAGIMTIHKGLYGEPDEKTLTFTVSDDTQFGPNDIIIIDESSMINDTVYKDIYDHTIKTGAKVIFFGDSFQLPPVKNSRKNKNFNILNEKDFEMTEVMRQAEGNPVLEVATILRIVNKKKGVTNFIVEPNTSSNLKDETTGEPLFKLTPNILEEYKESILAGENSILLVQTNNTRIRYNIESREAKFPDVAEEVLAEYPVLPGEKIISINTNKVAKGADTEEFVNGDILDISENFDVNRNIERVHGIQYTVWEWDEKLRRDVPVIAELTEAYIIKDGRRRILFVPRYDEASFPGQRIIGDSLPKSLRVMTDKGKLIFRPDYTIATYGYVITAHKAQGGQWNKVFISTNWIHHKDIAKWIYTAITRAEKSVVFETPARRANVPELYHNISWQKIREVVTKKKYLLPKTFQLQSASQQARTRKYAKMMFDKFEGKIPYEFINDPELTNELGMPVGAYYDKEKRKVVINLALSSPEAPFHEFMHPFIIDMRETNPVLFNNLLREILSTETGKDLLQDIAEAYVVARKTEFSNINYELGFLIDKAGGDINNLTADEIYKVLKENDDSDFTVSDELIAFTVSKKAAKLVPQVNKWRNILKKIMDWIRYRLFGTKWSVNVYARAMDANTSISDIARLLANSDRKFTLERVDRKLIGESFEFDINNRFKFMVFAEKESEKIDEDKDKAWLKRFFDDLWNKSHYDKGVKTDKDEYAAIMNSVLPLNARAHFSDWFRKKFRRAMPDEIPGFSYSGPIRDIAKEYIDSNQDMLDESTGRTTTDERELAPASILYIKEFGLPLTLAELRRITALAHDFDTYEQWRAQMFREVLKNQNIDTLIWQEDGLRQYYSRIRSTAVTNNGNIGLNEITNYELLIQSNGDFRLVEKGPEKKFRMENERKGNPGFQKKTLFDYYPEAAGLFSWLSGKDIRQIVISETGESKVDNIYDFLDEKQLDKLDRYLIDNYGMTIAFSRGDSDRLALVHIKDKASDMTLENITKYLKREVANGYMTKRQATEFLKEMQAEKSMKVRAANIAVHKAMKQVWPKYLHDIKGGPNVYKRLKIPFTPVTVNEKMDDSRVIYFNPRKVDFKFRGGKKFSPMQKVDGKKVDYIGDGETMTSKRRFNVFNKFLGLKVGTAIAKTVQYLKLGDLVYAKKHLQIQVEPGLVILDKKGGTLFEVNNNGNIYLGPAHPLFIQDGGEKNYVDELSTDYEIKIGTETQDEDGFDGIMAENDNQLYVPGSAVGLIKYEEVMDRHAKHPMQWYNHLTAPALLNHFREHYLPKLGKEMADAIRIVIDNKQGTAVEKMAKLAESLQNNADFGRIPTLLELLRLGSGFHRQTASIMDKLIQTKLIEPALQLAKGNGSSYSVAMDQRGILGNREIGISRQGAREVIDAFKKAKNLTSIKGIENDEINEWLNEKDENGEYINNIHAMVTRFPVPHEGGAYMGRIGYLHSRKGVITMNINDIKNRIEGDNDGDHAVVEFLPSEAMTRDYIEHLNNLKINTQNLDDYIDEKIKDSMISSSKRAKLIAKLTMGQKAIGEIANIQSAYGAISNIYNSIGEFKVRTPDQIIEVKGLLPGNKIWKGTVADYLRLWLQAAVDNAKYGFIGQWKYSREKIISNLFETMDGKNIDLSEEWMAAELDKILGLFAVHINASKIRNGRSFKEGNFSFRETLLFSNDYYAYTMDRTNYVWNNLQLETDIKNDSLNPIEMVAIAPALAMAQMHKKFPNMLDGFDVSPYIIESFLHKNAHVSTMKQMDVSKDAYLLDAILADGKSASDLDYTLAEIKKGQKYAENMGREFKKIRGDFDELGAESLDYNEKYLKWKEDYHEGFKNLSNVAKVAATYKFLEGYDDVAGNPIDKVGIYIPAISDKANQITMLDSKIMKDYFKTFNKQVRDSRNSQSNENFKVPAYMNMEMIARGLCE